MPDDPNPKLQAPDIEVLRYSNLSFRTSFEFSQMRLLDRYIIRNFLQPYFYCILGFLSIWLIFDISDNSSIIFDERAPFLLVVNFTGARSLRSWWFCCRFRCFSLSFFVLAGCRARTRSSRCSPRV
jgi:Predicted permeases